ncbi:hypothetical protein FSHL1_009887 [Fusarium sambucinum]
MSKLRQLKYSASDAASILLETYANKSAVRRQYIDANQLQKLAITLGRDLNGIDVSEQPPALGTPVPHGYHLAYFTPNGTESDLGADGTDRTFNASSPFTRRMWAGGKMTWANERLRVGDEVEERTRLLSAIPKKSRSAGEMVLVEVEKEFWGPRGLTLTDRRSWVFRPEIDQQAMEETSKPKASENVIRGPSLVRDLDTKSQGFPVRELQWSPVGLFRFSALTFNGHMIHYNDPWSERVEGHPGLVVHGPLNLINLLNYWRDVHGKDPQGITYRAMSPVYAGETYNIQTAGVRETDNRKTWDVNVEKEGVVCMKSEITA